MFLPSDPLLSILVHHKPGSCQGYTTLNIVCVWWGVLEIIQDTCLKSHGFHVPKPFSTLIFQGICLRFRGRPKVRRADA